MRGHVFLVNLIKLSIKPFVTIQLHYINNKIREECSELDSYD